MVALKRGSLEQRTLLAHRKQERRGGIETSAGGTFAGSRASGSRNAVVALKRETINATPPPGRGEAGTPWWH